MRTFVSAAATVLAVLLAAVAVPAIWLDRNIVQEQGFVELAAPLGKNSEFQQQLAVAAVGTIDTSAVPGFLSDLVQPVLEDAASSLTGLPEYPAAWEETLLKSHRLSFAAPGTDDGGASSASSLTLDVAPLVALGAGEISRTTRLPLDPPEQTLINVGQPEHKEWTERLSTYAPGGYLLAGGSAVALLLALVAARRRWTVLAGAGAGALLLAAGWAFGSQVASSAVVSADSGNEVANMFRNEFVAASAADFQAWTVAAALAGAVLLLLGLAAGLFSRKRARATR
ncbi:hypothetical protein Asphe3_26870 [Pseudarthrobacter phenanthrenivorans Sphe3]|uniref:Uncharacterized protein n=1 Tax=Pseudarthrobacter phenanthrenivorans (strain DSM 18606 / JCM 16027 / LMG 23796 / Sphe3) TaxID=930171 RepID=F0M907_PSEPM|nr:hypothetical protein [Pseudarthrobacter phenanthrenivorans]ADX73807.1 hypothetical protein Asphe3_26870 [Pseudarthrobacter phenanthrenivorans Sphe3]